MEGGLGRNWEEREAWERGGVNGEERGEPIKLQNCLLGRSLKWKAEARGPCPRHPALRVETWLPNEL